MDNKAADVPENSGFSFLLGNGFNVSNAVKKVLESIDVWIDSHTSWYCAHSSDSNNAIAIFGLCVDTRTGSPVTFSDDEVPDSLSSLLSLEWNWGGRYLFMYYNNGNCYAVQDATGSIPLFYTVAEGKIACSSNQFLLARLFGYEPNANLLAIRHSSNNIEQAMPDDITIYSEIFRLLPNHVINLGTGEVQRFVNFGSTMHRLTIDQVVNETLPRVENLARAYARKYNIALPVTAGKDSRMNLGVFKHLGIKVPCYTMKHPNHSGNEDDLVLPPKLASAVGYEYRQFSDDDTSLTMVEEANSWMAENLYGKSAVRMAKAIILNFGRCAIINGDSADQIGKSGMNNNVPAFLFSPRYLQTKIHNYSAHSRHYLKKWIQDYKISNEHLSISDCFAVESRVGRWANEQLTYSMFGLVSLNIYNSRSILYTWAKVSRLDRRTGKIHIGVLKQTCPELLEIPFEHNQLYAKIAKSNWLAFYFASLIKFHVGRVRFQKTMKDEKD